MPCVHLVCSDPLWPWLMPRATTFAAVVAIKIEAVCAGRQAQLDR